jgi:Fic family protein
MNSIKELKQKYNVTTKQISELLGIPLRTLQNWENGSREPAEYLPKLIDNNLSMLLKTNKKSTELVSNSNILADENINRILKKDFDTLTKEDIHAINLFYHYQMLNEMKRKDKGGIYGFTQRKLAYNSSKMEGNRLTENDTATLFETGIIPDGEYRSKDIEEMRGHFVMFNNAVNGFYNQLTEEMIKKYHYDLQCGVFEFLANGYVPGEYKRRVNIISNITTSSPENVQRDMQLLLSNYHSETNMDALEKITIFHSQYENIHPFQDGNGRTGRMILFKEGFTQDTLPIIINDERKKAYRDTLNLSQKQNEYQPLIDYMRDCQFEFYKILQEFLYDHKITLNNEEIDINKE